MHISPLELVPLSALLLATLAPSASAPEHSASVIPVSMPARALKCERTATELTLDTRQSSVQWRGTKSRGPGTHEGEARFGGGALCVRAGEVLAGWFEVDLRSLEVRDIPASDPVSRRRVRDHLLGPDFLHAAEHPVARFILRSAAEERDGRYRVAGDLTIRGRTRPATFVARVPVLGPTMVQAEASLEVDRRAFDGSDRGSTLKDDLVDDSFRLDIAILARARGLGT